MKLATYLSPWLPTEFYQALGGAWARLLSEDFHLVDGFLTSGPSLAEISGGTDPLSSGQVDCAVVCAPSYLWLREARRAVLLPQVPIFEEVGGPYFTSQVLVKAASPFKALSDLRGARWALNDPCSLSGHFSVLQALEKLSIGPEEIDFVASGGHLRSLEMLLNDEIDACAVDSNGLRFLLAEDSGLRERFRTIAVLGPYPAQPFTMGTADPIRSDELKTTFEKVCRDPELLSRLRSQFGLLGFSAIDDSHFDSLESLSPWRHGGSPRGLAHAPGKSPGTT